jgi:hypothetical protein
MHAEQETVDLLKRLVPDVDKTWQPATDADLAALDEVTIGPLPPFYEWFLRTMGRSIGKLAHPAQDLRVTTILHAYQTSVVFPEPNRLLVGRHPEQMAPKLSLYALDEPTRDDALVLSCVESGHGMRRTYETFREMLAWTTMLGFGVEARAQTCRVDFFSDDDPVVEILTPVLTDIGFTVPVATGLSCGLFEREDAILAGKTEPSASKEPQLFCRFGADNAKIARKVIGHVALETDLRVEVGHWRPQLP